MPHPGRFTPTKETQYLIAQEASGSQGRSGRVRKISPPSGFRFQDLPARSESLYHVNALFWKGGECVIQQVVRRLYKLRDLNFKALDTVSFARITETQNIRLAVSTRIRLHRQ